MVSNKLYIYPQKIKKVLLVSPFFITMVDFNIFIETILDYEQNFWNDIRIERRSNSTPLYG